MGVIIYPGITAAKDPQAQMKIPSNRYGNFSAFKDFFSFFQVYLLPSIKTAGFTFHLISRK
jgi:hypothetical protein